MRNHNRMYYSISYLSIPSSLVFVSWSQDHSTLRNMYFFALSNSTSKAPTFRQRICENCLRNAKLLAEWYGTTENRHYRGQIYRQHSSPKPLVDWSGIEKL